jgi:hypothetical protein
MLGREYIVFRPVCGAAGGQLILHLTCHRRAMSLMHGDGVCDIRAATSICRSAVVRLSAAAGGWCEGTSAQIVQGGVALAGRGPQNTIRQLR